MLKNYLIMAFKVLLRRKFFTLISLACISMTLAILMVAATFVDNFIGNVSPETKKNRTLTVSGVVLTKENGGYAGGAAAYQFLNKFVDIGTLPNIEMASISTRVIPGRFETEAILEDVAVRLNMRRTDGNYWKILEFDFLDGGPLTEEDMTDANYVTVINQSTRKKLFGADPAIGRMITLDGLRFKVKGVVKDVSELQLAAYSDAWIPISTSKTKTYLNDTYWGMFMGIILANSRDDFPLIKSEYTRRIKELSLPDKYNGIYSSPCTSSERFSEIFLSGVAATLFGEYSSDTTVIILTIAVILFLILPVINIVNINLCRMGERASEIGVRKAFGASSLVLIGQFAAENFILTFLGGILGVFICMGVIHVLNATDMENYYFHYRMFLWGLVAIFVFNLLSSAYPAWRMSRFHPVDALRIKG